MNPIEPNMIKEFEIAYILKKIYVLVRIKIAHSCLKLFNNEVK